MSLINLALQDAQLSVAANLPAANANVTTGVIDLQNIAPNSETWRRGLFVIQCPAIPENIANIGITVTMQVTNASLINSPPAPQLPVPGAFIAPPVAQVLTIAAVAGTGSLAQNAYMTLPLDGNGNPYQFYQFVIATPAGTNPNAETITISFGTLSD